MANKGIIRASETDDGRVHLAFGTAKSDQGSFMGPFVFADNFIKRSGIPKSDWEDAIKEGVGL